MIIKEGRKEDVYSRYEYPIRVERGLNAFIEPVSFYDLIIQEPFFEETGYKYLEPLVKYHYKDKNYNINDKPFTVPKSRDFLIRSRNIIQNFVDTLKFFEVHNSKYKFKDFNQYVNKNMLTDFFAETVKLRDEYELKNQQKLAKKQSEKIYEDKDLVVVKPMSYEASCYYGAGTRWCTTRKNETIHFSNYGKTMGRLYYFIFKDKTISDPMYKVAAFFKFTPSEKQKINYDDISLYNAKDDLLDFQQKTSFFSELPSGLFETIVKNFEEDQSKNASANQLVRDSISEFESRGSKVSHDFNYLGDKVRIEFSNLVDMSDQNIEFKCNYEITVDNNPKLYSSGKVYIAIAMSTMDVLLTFYPDSGNTFNFIRKGDTHETKLNFVPKYYRAPSFIVHDMLKELSEMMSELILQTRPI